MFTQRISMNCTKEQYEKYLKDELLKMGYKEWSINYWEDVDFCYMCNSHNGNIGNLGTIHKTNARSDKRTYLGSFNAPLFLALAAMTDEVEGNYGEYIIGLRSGNFYKMTEGDRVLPEYNMVRKATKEEIMTKFGNITFETTLDTKEALGVTEAEIRSINLLKSKGYKILKPKIWEEV